MVVHITTKTGTTATKLLTLIKKAIKDGSVKTWAYDSATGFTHVASSKQWDTGAYLSPVASNDSQILKLFFKQQAGSTIESDTYGVLNGRFVSMVLNHFTDVVDHITVRDRRK